MSGVSKVNKKSNLEKLLLELFETDKEQNSQADDVEKSNISSEITPLAVSDKKVLASLQSDTEKMELGITDPFFDDAEETKSTMPHDTSGLDETSYGIDETILSGKSIIQELINALSGKLRYNSPKKGAYRVQPVDSNNPPPADYLLKAMKAKKIIVVNIIPPKAPGSKSTKFSTYVIKKGGSSTTVEFVYGQGRNAGQKFEDETIQSMQGLISGKISPLAQNIAKALKINVASILSVDVASKKRVVRSLTGELSNVGEMISDMTITLNRRTLTYPNKKIYVSIKNVSGDTFSNNGYAGVFIQQKSKMKPVIVPAAGSHKLDIFLVSGLGINKQLLASGLTDYINQTPTINPVRKQSSTFDAGIVKRYLASAYGYGYWYIRQVAEGSSKIKAQNILSIDMPEMLVGDIVDVTISYPFWSESSASKQLTANIITTNGTYILEIRNSQAGVVPNEVKIRTRGKFS